MVAHIGLVQWNAVDEQITLKNRVSIDGQTGQITVKSSFSASSKASVTGLIFSFAILSNVEQYLKRTVHNCALATSRALQGFQK